MAVDSRLVASHDPKIVAGLQLPEGLEKWRPEFAEALAGAELGAWPEEPSETYIDATGHAPDKIQRVMRKLLHEDLPRGLRFGVAWRNELRLHGARCAATISRAGGKLAFFANLDVILEIDWEIWRRFKAEQRLALIDHELHHLVYDLEKERLGIVGHDVEEFGSIVRRWGLWRPNLVTFAGAARAQLDLLPDYLLEIHQRAERGEAPPLDEGFTPGEAIKAADTNPPSPPTAASRRGGKPARKPGKVAGSIKPTDEGLAAAATAVGLTDAPQGPRPADTWEPE